MLAADAHLQRAFPNRREHPIIGNFKLEPDIAETLVLNLHDEDEKFRAEKVAFGIAGTSYCACA
jgi:hypothetical protein